MVFMEATVHTLTASTVHVYYDLDANKFIVGDVDIILVDPAGLIVGQTTSTANGLPAALVAEVVDAQLSVFAGPIGYTPPAEPVVLWRNYDGRTGYYAVGSVTR